MPILHNLFQKMEEKGIFLKSLYEANITLMPEPDKYTTRKENYIPISLMNTDAKIPPKLASRIQQYIRKRIHPTCKWVLSQECKAGSIFKNQ